MDIFPKFIIETDEELGDCLIIAKCTYHNQLATFKEKVKGGGLWSFNREENTFILSGRSDEFGYANLEDLQRCVKLGNVFTNSTLQYSIADEHNFLYNTGSEIIDLKKEIEVSNIKVVEVGAGMMGKTIAHALNNKHPHLIGVTENNYGLHHTIPIGTIPTQSPELKQEMISEFNNTLESLVIPYKMGHDPKMLEEINRITFGDVPNKLDLLRKLKLSPEQIDYFQNAPPQRMEGESQEDYKTRRMLNKLIIKYRGEF